MGAKDTATTIYMSRNEIFADIFNFFIYGGRKVINPDDLREVDSKEVGYPYGGSKGNKEPVQKFRDVIKSVSAMTDSRVAYLLLAIENQSNVHYAMPVKNMIYDALQYTRQVNRATSTHRLSDDFRKIGKSEYLSGFTKSDRLVPVITLAVYFGPDEWDGPLSLHEMFSNQDPEILALVPDYRINLITPASIKDEDFDKMSSTLKEVLKFIKYSKNADKLQEMMNSDEAFQHLGRDEVEVLNACVGTKLKIKKNEEVIDVCQAIQTMNDRAEARGLKRGEQTYAERLKTLHDRLIAEGREDEFVRAATVYNYANKLFKEFGI